MTKTIPSDTIAAIATPVGEGSIAVLRVSGPGALAAVSRGFRGSAALDAARSQTAHVGDFVGPDGGMIDQVVATIFRTPGSYTGEDVIEISCHGGILVPRLLLDALVAYGCRLAGPGEFTKRAFLNGKLDLSQAEAVADLIRARSDRAQASSLRQLKGELGGRIRDLRDGLIRTAGLLELELDFVEEGLEFADKKRVANEIRLASDVIQDLMRSYGKGRIYREGVKVVLAGMPNVGKSSIMNALLKENRAIVTEIPGTTRDTIEETISIDGVAFRIVDTAGLRETLDRVEMEGVRRSEDQINDSDIVVLVIDSGRAPDSEELSLAGRLIGSLSRHSSAIVALNKIDLAPRANGTLEQAVRAITRGRIVKVSALTGEGIDRLRETLFREALNGAQTENESSVTVTNARHFDSLYRAGKSLNLSLASLESGASGELVAPDLRAALDALGEIIGAVTTDDILNEIFSTFCIGK